jgi:hypothetical protein
MWSIGIYRGESPFSLRPHPKVNNPVIRPNDVTDLRGVSIADPFMLVADGIWHMFFEVLDGDTEKGKIGLATSADAVNWTYKQIILAEQFHLSYPYAFRAGKDYYMIPETVDGGGICLYRATRFPFKWSLDRLLVKGVWADPSIFHFEGKWWLFACGTPKESNSLHLFYSNDLFGPWVEHPLSPLITGDNRTARPAGRVTVYNGGVVRFCQDCEPKYGSRVRAFEITKLTTAEYQEKEHPLSPILMPTGEGWNSERMHHIDPHLRRPGEWVACVDGLS